jgi:transcriptional regulator with XRE-family HTH domain
MNSETLNETSGMIQLIAMPFVEKITKLAKEKGWTQQDLEVNCGLARGKMSKWKESGEPTASQAIRIANALGVTVEICWWPRK